MKSISLLISIFFSFGVFAQPALPELYGFQHIQIMYKADTVDVLIRSKQGEEKKQKPLFLFCQGSLPIPLIIKYDAAGKQGIYPVFVFNPDSLANDYHVAIIGKPYVPLICDQKKLNQDFTYRDRTGKYPAKYIERNLPDYYVDRNIAVIKFLQDQNWISKTQLVIAGHSEGSSIAAKIAFKFPAVTQLIYSGGNPYGRILSMIEQARKNDNDSASGAEKIITQWNRIVEDPGNMEATNGDPNKTTYDFSIPSIGYLQDLKMPVLVTYGTADVSSPFNDLLRVEMIRQKKDNFSFKAYIGTEHNYFPLKPGGETNYEIFNWDKVAAGWRSWLSGK